MEFVENFNESERYSLFDDLQDTKFFIGCTYSLDERERDELIENLPEHCKVVIIARTPTFSVPEKIRIIPPKDSKTVHSKIYCFFKTDKVVCVVGTFNLTSGGLYGGGELMTILEANLRKPDPETILENPSYARGLTTSSVICCVLEYLGALANRDSGRRGSLSDSWVKSDAQTVFVHTDGLNSLRTSLTGLPGEKDTRLSLTYLTPFLSPRGIQEFIDIFKGRDIDLTIVTNDPRTFASRYDSSNFIKSVDHLRSLVGKLRFCIWRRNKRLSMPSICSEGDIKGGFLHMKVITADFQMGGRNVTWTWLTSANLSQRVWSEEPDNHECAILDKDNYEASDIKRLVEGIVSFSYDIQDDEDYWKKIRRNLEENDKRLRPKEILLKDQVAFKGDWLSKGLLVDELLSKSILFETDEDSGIERIEALMKFIDLDAGEISETEKVELPLKNGKCLLDLSSFSKSLPPVCPNRLPTELILHLTSDFGYPDVVLERPSPLFTKTKSGRMKLNMDDLESLYQDFDVIVVKGKYLEKGKLDIELDTIPRKLRLRKKGIGSRTEVFTVTVKTFLAEEPFTFTGIADREIATLGTCSVVSLVPAGNVTITPFDFFVEDQDGSQYRWVFCPCDKHIEIAIVEKASHSDSMPSLRMGVDKRLREAFKQWFCETPSIPRFLPHGPFMSTIGDPSASPLVHGVERHKELPMEKFVVEGARIRFNMIDCNCVVLYSWGNMSRARPKEISKSDPVKLDSPNLDLEYRCMCELGSSGWFYLSQLTKVPILVRPLTGPIYRLRYENYPFLQIDGEEWLFDDLRSSVTLKISSDGELAKELQQAVRMRGSVRRTVFPLPRSLLKGRKVRTRIHCIPQSPFLGGVAETVDIGLSKGKLTKRSPGKPTWESSPWNPLREDEIAIRIPFEGYSREDKIFDIPIQSLELADYFIHPLRVSREKADLILHLHLRRFAERFAETDLFAISIVNR